jgi:glycine/D-amino acid oxidase-like deaminating enzyme
MRHRKSGIDGVKPSGTARTSRRDVVRGLSPSADGSTLSADEYVFACGSWLPRLFPDVLGSRIQLTRREVFFFGTPAGDLRFSEGAMPVWVDFVLRRKSVDPFFGLARVVKVSTRRGRWETRA